MPPRERPRRMLPNPSRSRAEAPSLPLSLQMLLRSRCVFRQTKRSSGDRQRRSMEKRQLGSAALLLMAVMVMVVVSAEAGGGQGLCKMSEEGLAACKPCISSVKAQENPTDECCAALKQADLPCLCRYQKSPLLGYLGIDPKLAMQLPPKCNLTLPSQCP